MKEATIKKHLKSLFAELESSYFFAESASISGDFDIEDMPDVVMRGKIIFLNLENNNISNENKEYEIECLKDMFNEMTSSYDFACECAETMDVDIDSDDMYDITNYAIKKLSELESIL